LTLLDKNLISETLFENIQTQSYNDLEAALRIAEERVIAELATSTDEMSRDRLNKIKALITNEIAKSYSGLFESLQDEAVEAAALDYGLMLGTIGATLPKKTVDDIVNSRRLINMSPEKAYEFKELFKITEENHARQLRTVIAAGVAQGKPSQEIVKDFKIESDRLSKGQINTNIKTVMGQSRKFGRHKSYQLLEKEGVVDGYVYNATLDGRTSLYCRDMDGTVEKRPITEISNLVKVHANCRSEWLPLTKNKKDNTRASQFGQTKENNFESWFLKQPEWFKKQTLTNRQYSNLLKDRYKVKSLADITKKQRINDVRNAFKRMI